MKIKQKFIILILIILISNFFWIKEKLEAQISSPENFQSNYSEPPSGSRENPVLLEENQPPPPNNDSDLCKDPPWYMKPACWIMEGVKNLFTKFMKIVASIIIFIINLFNSLFAKIADYLQTLNPFAEEENSPVQVLWNILKSFAYIIFTFAILAAGFMWLLENENAALGIIFNIIIAALLINFTYTLVKIAFSTFHSIENGLTGETIVGDKGSLGIGSLIYASLWQKNPIDDITQIVKESKGSDEFFIETGTVLIGHLFLIAFAMITFVVLVVISALLVARYIMIIFLTAVSPIAIASLAFPKFQRGPLARIISSFNFFEFWLEKLVNWLLVVPIVIIMVILGNVLVKNTIDQISGKVSSLHSLIEFIIVFLLILGWYILSLMTANKLSGNVSKIATGFAIGSLSLIGTSAATGLTRLGGSKVGGALTKIGETTAKLPANSLTAPVINLGRKIKETGAKMQEKSYEGIKQAAQYKISTELQNFQRATTQEQKDKHLREIEKTVKKYGSNPIVSKALTDELEKAPQSVFENITNNPQIAQSFLSSNLTPEFQRMIGSKISNLSSNALSKMLTDTWLPMIQNTGPEVISGFIKGIEKLDDATLITEINQNIRSNQLSTQTLQNLNSKLKGTLDKQTKGLFTALEQQNIASIANAYAKLNSDAWENINEIKDLTTKYNADFDQAILEALQLNPSNILKGVAMVHDDPNKRNILQTILRSNFNNPNDVAQKLGLSQNETRLVNIIWQ